MKKYWTLLSVELFMMLLFAASCEKEVPPKTGDFQQIEPTAGSKEVSTSPTFTWGVSANATHYSLLVSTKNDFSILIINEKNIEGNAFAPSTPLSDGFLYYWKVIASNKDGSTDASNAGISFRTASTTPLPSPDISKYYISPLGEDNPDRGTMLEPFRTLAYAATRVPPSEGDTILIKAGTYIETDPARVPIGVNVIGEDETATILSSAGVTLSPGINAGSSDFKLSYEGSLIQLVSTHFSSGAIAAPANGNQTIGGFTILATNKDLKVGVWVENRNNVTMHHVTFKSLGQRGAVFAPGGKPWYTYPEFYMTNTKIHDCTFFNSGRDLTDETLGNLCIAQLDGADIYNINIQDTEGYGIKFIYDGYFKNMKIHDCNIELNETDSKWGEDIAIELWNLGPGNSIYNINCNTWLSIVNHPEMFGSPTGTENMKVYNVKMIDKDGLSNKESIEIGTPGVEIYDSYFENKGIGIAIWDMGRENVTIRNNIFYNTTSKYNWADGAAVYIDNSRTWSFTDINIYNNVFDTHKVQVNIKGNNISNVYVRNNAFLNTTTTDVQASGTNITNIIFENNLKYTTTDELWFVTGVTSQLDNIRGIPGFVNSGERWDTYYKPSSSGSLVVDKGIYVGISFTGSAPDIGRYEF